MASPSHRPTRRRPPLRRRRTALVSVAAVAAVGLVAFLVTAFGPDREADAGRTAGTPVAGTGTAAGTGTSDEATVRPTASERKPATASATPTPDVTTPAPARTTTAPARPSATSPSRTAAAGASPAGRIRPGVTYQGVATHYDAGNGDGACQYGPTDDLMTAAMNHTDYEVSKACGAYVLVRAAGGASVTVRITNECPLPCAPGQLDLSTQAFAELAAPAAGRIPITWSLLSPRTSEKISIRYKTGSSRYWCGIQVIGHRNPLARLEVGSGSGRRQLPRTEYNYFLSENGSGCGEAIRITDIYGERLTVDGLAVKPDVVQPTRVQFAEH